MWTVYIIQSEKDKGYYVGCSSNLNRRLKEHNLGQNLSTINRRPWKLVYGEEYDNSKEAFSREKQIKSYKGGNGLKKLLSDV